MALASAVAHECNGYHVRGAHHPWMGRRRLLEDESAQAQDRPPALGPSARMGAALLSRALRREGLVTPEKRRARQREHQARYRDRLVANGKCIACRGPGRPGKRVCIACQRRDSAKQHSAKCRGIRKTCKCGFCDQPGHYESTCRRKALLATSSTARTTSPLFAHPSPDRDARESSIRCPADDPPA